MSSECVAPRSWIWMILTLDGWASPSWLGATPGIISMSMKRRIVAVSVIVLTLRDAFAAQLQTYIDSMLTLLVAASVVSH